MRLGFRACCRHLVYSGIYNESMDFRTALILPKASPPGNEQMFYSKPVRQRVETHNQDHWALTRPQDSADSSWQSALATSLANSIVTKGVPCKLQQIKLLQKLYSAQISKTNPPTNRPSALAYKLLSRPVPVCYSPRLQKGWSSANSPCRRRSEKKAESI